MSKVMVELRCPDHHPTLQEVAERYRLAPADLDSSFGVIEVDPHEHRYVVLVEPAAGARMTKSPDAWQATGPFANPPIAPMNMNFI